MTVGPVSLIGVFGATLQLVQYNSQLDTTVLVYIPYQSDIGKFPNKRFLNGNSYILGRVPTFFMLD